MTRMPETGDEAKREFNAACLQAAQSARVQMAHEMNQLLRRFRQYEKEADWVRLVIEGAGNYAREAALFAVQDGKLRLRGAVNLNLVEGLSLEVKNTFAFDAVLRSKEAVTALRSSGEVGAALSSPGRLAYLFPISNGSRVVAILFANGEDAEVDQLELVANMAAGALERQTNSGIHSQIATLPAVPPPVAVVVQRSLLPWAGMALEQRALHSQALRYARVTVAEMQLLKPAACRAAREKGDLYVALGREIDKAREIYRRRFMILPSMADYFHRELIGFILQGDSTKLGADYPGELA
jgi:hypothetical protein